VSETPEPPRTPRPSLSVHWKCCNVYARVYLNREETYFAGNCPRCAKPMRIRAVKGGGSKARFWTVE